MQQLPRSSSWLQADIGFLPEKPLCTPESPKAYNFPIKRRANEILCMGLVFAIFGYTYSQHSRNAIWHAPDRTSGEQDTIVTGKGSCHSRYRTQLSREHLVLPVLEVVKLW